MKKTALLLPALLLCLLGGCGSQDYRELDQLELVETLGVDGGDERVTVTASAASREEPVVLRREAATIHRALREMQNYTPRKYIFYGHTRQLLVGESAAVRGIDFCLSYLERDAEMRLGTDFYLVKGGTAEEMVSRCGAERGGIGKLLDSLEKDVQLLSESHVFSCGEIAEWLLENGSGIAAAVELTETDSIVAGEDPLTVQSAGYGVFVDGKLAEYIAPDAARAVNLLMELGGGDAMELSDGRGGYTAVRLTKGTVHFHPEYGAGRLQRLGIELRLSCSIEELQHDLQGETGVLALETAVSALEKQRVEAVTELMKKLNCDFLHIGNRVRAVNAREYDRSEWNVADCEYPVEVRTEIERSYE